MALSFNFQGGNEAVPKTLDCEFNSLPFNFHLYFVFHPLLRFTFPYLLSYPTWGHREYTVRSPWISKRVLTSLVSIVMGDSDSPPVIMRTSSGRGWAMVGDGY
ncbi:hypothetical protein AVEN_185012-1 [Araneus ventricosus]|uniref:Uncharacterized protein n=1 Tax=Araneus ventricosus TaxID=182803 RepID=A0A4Y2BRV5_ARAVE|nr:hypothetical protein AVEN_185012-1 [Araneus ventricosus]